VLADTANLSGSIIRHEMLHALLGPLVGGHPRNQFLGRCAGTVACSGKCITEAGPPPPPDSAAVTVDPSALEITSAIDPVAPRGAIDDGWFTFTIMVTNPRTTPVVVALPPSGNASPPITYYWDIRFLTVASPAGSFPDLTFGGRADDMASATRFAPGETKRIVADNRVGDRGSATLPPGTYVFTGSFGARDRGGISAKPDTVILEP